MAHPRRFRFGAELHTPFEGMTWAESVRRVEELGYSTVFLPDHFGVQFGPIAAMAAAAASTTTLKVGSLVFDNDFRHPVVLAKEVATIDVLSEGRLEFGIGAGWKSEDYDSSGIPMDSPKVRVDRMMEAVTIMKGLFGPDPVNFSGDHYQVTDLVGTPVPATPGGPPFIIAGGSKRMLRFAGTHASIVGVNPSIHSGAIDADAARDSLSDRMDQKLEWVRDGAGDRFDDLEINAWIPVAAITDDSLGFAELIAPSFGIASEEAISALDSPMTMVGSVGQIAERLEFRRERWGFSYHVLQDQAVLEMAPVIADLAGS